MKRIVIALVAIALVSLVPISLAAAPPQPTMPFVGMTLVYSVIRGDQAETRVVNVLFYNATTKTVIVRDSTPAWLDVMQISLATREIVWYSGTCTGCGSDPIYAEYWIPTKVHMGSHVPILNFDAVVIGSKTLSVSGKTVSAWQLQTVYVDEVAGRVVQDTWYYAKSDGVWIGASFVVIDAIDGHTVYQSWGGTLLTTNAL